TAPLSTSKLSTPWYGSGSELSLPVTPESEPQPANARGVEPMPDATHEIPLEPEPAGSASEEVTMPAWLDEVIERKKAADPGPEGPKPQVVSAKLPAPHIAPPPPPPIPARVVAPAIPPRPTAPTPAPVSAESNTEYISARLREKLDAAEARKRGSNATPWFVAAILLAAVAVTMILMVRFGGSLPWGKNHATRAANTAAAHPDAVPASDSAVVATPPVARSASQTPATHAEPLPASNANAEPAPGEPATVAVAATEPATPKPAAKPAAAKPKKMYGIVVGTYFDESRAADVASKAGAPLGLPTRTVPVTEDGAAMYQAVVGRFEDRARAESAASRLSSAGKVGEARVVALGTATK
ncbi:MAG TPA: SPOR domain-containing protein, partial [Dongiaceae bacterium]|nr:SPOR domain-containing protein [Dongiaceae bacterium]